MKKLFPVDQIKRGVYHLKRQGGILLLLVSCVFGVHLVIASPSLESRLSSFLQGSNQTVAPAGENQGGKLFSTLNTILTPCSQSGILLGYNTGNSTPICMTESEIIEKLRATRISASSSNLLLCNSSATGTLALKGFTHTGALICVDINE